MDAYKPENISPDSENLPLDLIDTETNVLAQNESHALDSMAAENELSDPPSLEEEFADVAQQAVSDLGQFDMSAPETESDVDLDEEFAAFQTSQPLGDDDHADSESAVDFESELSQVEALLGNERGETPSEVDAMEDISGWLDEQAVDCQHDLELAPEEDAIATESSDVAMMDVDAALEEVSESSLAQEIESEGLGAIEPAAMNDVEVISLSQASDEELEESTDAAQSNEKILELESTIQQNQAQIAELQTLVNSKIDPDVHAHLLQELGEYKTQVSELEASLQTLREEQQSAPASFSADDYETLQQLADEQKQTIAELQATVTQLEQDVKDRQSQVESQIDPAQYDALQAQSTTQGELIANLESEIQSLKADYEQSQVESAQKIEPAEYQSAQAEIQQLTAQVQDLEQRYETLSQELVAQTQLATDRIDPQTHADLNQTLQEYRDQIKTLQDENAQLEQAVQTWQKKAEDKIDRAEYEAVLEQIQILKEKNARSLWARIIDWFMGK